MNNNIKISVVMPVYNAEQYIDKAISSIQQQTFKHYELILVDDGSQDNSLAICNSYAQKDKRIKPQIRNRPHKMTQRSKR